MRVFLKTGLRRLGTGWIWALALLTLPNCALEEGGLGGPANLDRGPTPESSAVFCDIESSATPRTCATDAEVAAGLRLNEAAEAMVAGRTAPWGIDDSATARSHCGGNPEKVVFNGPYPQGMPVCINCSVIPSPHADAAAVCVAQCLDTDPGGSGSCNTRARVSVNATSPTFCFGGACSSDAVFIDSFVDPRRTSEPVAWQNAIGVATSGPDNNTLTRTLATDNTFDAGAASSQTIAQADGYVQFIATETNAARLCGLANGAPPDTVPDITDINFAIDLFKDGHFYVFENGTKILGPDSNAATLGSFGTYAPGDKFRVYVTRNNDGSGQITYAKITGPCSDGSPCPEVRFYTSLTSATYPLRVDSSFREQNGTLTDVRLVRIR